MRVTASVKGEANAKCILDAMKGRNVRWTPPAARCDAHLVRQAGSLNHLVTFDHDSPRAAREHLRDLFPAMRVAVRAVPASTGLSSGLEG